MTMRLSVMWVLDVGGDSSLYAQRNGAFGRAEGASRDDLPTAEAVG
jgi:hypothetical protein